MEIIKEGRDDIVLPFAVEALDVRGRVVRLGKSLDDLLQRHQYPDAVARIVGEAITLTALLGSALKFEGRFQLQTKTDGAVEMIVVDYDAPDKMRACAHYNKEKLDEALKQEHHSTQDLIGTGVLALTIDQGTDMNRYQGIVALEAGGFEAAAHQYFRQSEQIPTRIRLAVAEEIINDHGPQHLYRAGGIIVQYLPQSEDRMRAIDIDPGNAPEGVEKHEDAWQDELWTEAEALVSTVEDLELVDPQISSERLLYRLFHERGARVFEGQALHEACHCSEQRIIDMMKRFSESDRQHMIGDNGRVVITCEFCSRVYDLDPVVLEQEMVE